MAEEKTRLWLMFPARLITRPIIWELGKKFEVVTNVRQASITDEVGLVSLSLAGERDEIKRAIAWLEELGVKVEPVEIYTIEG
jgi:ABC-type methionine transport system ATPase subunit